MVGFTTKYNPHKALMDKLAEQRNFDDELELSKILQDLKELREKADYDGILPVDQSFVRRFMLRLEDAIEIYENNK